MKQNRSSINSVEKALHILMAFNTEHPSWGVRELGAHLGFSPATVQRALQTLKTYGFVCQDPETRQYRLGSIFWRFSGTLQSTTLVNQAALPFMKRLLTKTRETVHLNVIDGYHRICIESIESSQALKASMPVGHRSPLYAGASSKCLLAFSSQDFIQTYIDQIELRPLSGNTITDIHKLRTEIAVTKKRGYAVSLGERTPGLGSLSAPIQDHHGVILAAMSLAIPELRFQDPTYRSYCLRELLLIAQELSAVTGYPVNLADMTPPD